MANVIVQVFTASNEIFKEIDEDRLKEIAGRLKSDKETLSEMRQSFFSHSNDTQVSRASEADYILVVDGHEDEASWKDLIESFG